jgi:ribosomal protein S3AE
MRQNILLQLLNIRSFVRRSPHLVTATITTPTTAGFRISQEAVQLSRLRSVSAKSNAMNEVIPVFPVTQQSVTQLPGVATREEREGYRRP